MDLYSPRPGETPHLFELGLPVEPHSLPWHVDVQQRIPLAAERDAARDAYKRTLAAILLESLAPVLSRQELSGAWVTEVLAHFTLGEEALAAYVEKVLPPRAVLSVGPRVDDRARQLGAKVVDLRGVPAGGGGAAREARGGGGRVCGADGGPAAGRGGGPGAARRALRGAGALSVAGADGARGGRGVLRAQGARPERPRGRRVRPGAPPAAGEHARGGAAGGAAGTPGRSASSCTSWRTRRATSTTSPSSTGWRASRARRCAAWRTGRTSSPPSPARRSGRGSRSLTRVT